MAKDKLAAPLPAAPPGPDGNGGMVALVITGCALILGPPAGASETLRNWHWGQLAAVAAISAYWMHVTVALNTPSASKKSAQMERLDRAADMQKVSGLTRGWYEGCAKVLSRAKLGGGVLAGGALAALFFTSYPTSVFGKVGGVLQSTWTSLLKSHSTYDLWLGTTFGLHFAMFWPIGIISAVLELWRPACLEPFKVQQDVRLKPSQLGQGVVVALGNQALLLLSVAAIYRYFPPLEATAFAPQLPSLQEAIVHLACCIVVSEILFYAGHCLLHFPWMFAHIHYVHHLWASPIAIASIYAHPVEFLLANIPVIAFGPMLMQSHLSVYCVWVLAATWKIMSGHLGWNIPFVGSPDSHDFHHSLNHGNNLNNLGQIGVLDAYYETQKDWNASWQARIPGGAYTSPDYPVDKALVMPKTVGETMAA